MRRKLSDRRRFVARMLWLAVLCCTSGSVAAASPPQPAPPVLSHEPQDSCRQLPDTLRPQVIPDSLVRRLARDLGMMDSAQAVRYADSLRLSRTDSLPHAAPLSRYEKIKERRIRHWMKLIPNQFTLQYAGSIGMFSAGPGWSYGKGRHWETDFLIGFVPKYRSEDAKATFTLKQRYVPWHCVLNRRLTIQPLMAGVFFNTVTGEDFWAHQPRRYPKSYYGFSTKIRAAVFLGQRLRYNIPRRKRRINSAVSVFYEISSCDLYIVTKATNKSVPWREVLSLAFGFRWEM